MAAVAYPWEADRVVAVFEYSVPTFSPEDHCWEISFSVQANRKMHREVVVVSSLSYRCYCLS